MAHLLFYRNNKSVDILYYFLFICQVLFSQKFSLTTFSDKSKDFARSISSDIRISSEKTYLFTHSKCFLHVFQSIALRLSGLVCTREEYRSHI